jgi:uncharacterized membrane protein
MKPFKETAVGKFLSGKGFNSVINAAGSMIPGVKLLNDVKEMVMGSDEYKTLSPEDQQLFIELHRQELEELDKRLADLANARDLYSDKNVMADEVAKRIINWNLPIIATMVLILIACIIYVPEKTLLALISTAIGSVTGQLLSERQNIINFFFGSSLGSKQKTEVLNKLTDSINNTDNSTNN